MSILSKKQSTLLGGYYDFERPTYPDPYKDLGKSWPMPPLKPKLLKTKPINPYLLPLGQSEREQYEHDFYSQDTKPSRSLKSYSLDELYKEQEQAARFEQNIGGLFGRDPKTGSFRFRAGPHHVMQSMIGTAVPVFGLATNLMRAAAGLHRDRIDKEIARRVAEDHTTYPLKKKTSQSTKKPFNQQDRHVTSYGIGDVTIIDRPQTFSRESFHASPERYSFERTDHKR